MKGERFFVTGTSFTKPPLSLGSRDRKMISLNVCFNNPLSHPSAYCFCSHLLMVNCTNFELITHLNWPKSPTKSKITIAKMDLRREDHFRSKWMRLVSGSIHIFGLLNDYAGHPVRPFRKWKLTPNQSQPININDYQSVSDVDCVAC